jgi:hypothetical protein
MIERTMRQETDVRIHNSFLAGIASLAFLLTACELGGTSPESKGAGVSGRQEASELNLPAANDTPTCDISAYWKLRYDWNVSKADCSPDKPDACAAADLQQKDLDGYIASHQLCRI